MINKIKPYGNKLGPPFIIETLYCVIMSRFRRGCIRLPNRNLPIRRCRLLQKVGNPIIIHNRSFFFRREEK